MTYQESFEPQVYIQCLACYNAGRLNGRYIDANQDPDSIREEVAALLEDCSGGSHEEWAVHDYDNMPSILGEYPSLEEISEVAELITEHGKLAIRVFEELDILEATREALKDHYLGCFKSVEDYAYEFINDTYELNEFLGRYFDYRSFARDLELGGDIFTVEFDGDVHVFHNF